MAKDSNFKTSFIEIPKRISFKRLAREGIIAYDKDNVYPQRTELLIKGSATAKAVYKLYKDFITGEGFRDQTLASLVVNSKDQKLNEIHKKVVKDLAAHNGFCLHFNMDVLGQIHEITHIPFKWARLPDDDPVKAKTNHGRLAIYEDWDQVKYKSWDPKRVQWIFPFNPDPIAIEEQIFLSGPDPKKAGTLEDWKGQVYYWTTEEGGYIESPLDCSALDMETDQELALFRNSLVMSSFMASYAAVFKQKFENDKESLEMDENLKKVTGGRHAGNMIKIEGVGEDTEAVQFMKLETIDHDGLFEDTEKSTQSNIRKSVLAPAELVGETFSSGFDTERIRSQRQYYNSLTRDERETLSAEWEKIAQFTIFPAMTSAKDFEIIPLYEDELEEVTQEQNEKTTKKEDDGAAD